MKRSQERSPKSREFGIKLTLPQIDAVLTALLFVPNQYVNKPESHDAASDKLKALYESVVGREWEAD